MGVITGTILDATVFVSTKAVEYATMLDAGFGTAIDATALTSIGLFLGLKYKKKQDALVKQTPKMVK